MMIKGINCRIKFGSKAQTLRQLAGHPIQCTIPEFSAFSFLTWKNDPDRILHTISSKSAIKTVAVRSSALCEDGAVRSYAGSYKSVLNIDAFNLTEMREAIDQVFASYKHPHDEDEVLIQQMVTDITVSGVILTRCVDDGSPYYVINYDDESGKSDSVTGGKGIHKTVMVYRKFNPEYCESSRVRKMLDMAGTIEEICGHIPLDIEFAMDRGGCMHLLQVRRISTVSGWHPDTEHRVCRMIPHTQRFVAQLSARKKGLFGACTILGNMPDWNPAELIGVIPSPLAASLFRYLITSRAWSEARRQMGYLRIPKTELMVIIAGRSFIDVRASFNSFLPDGIPEAIAEKLINAWLDRLKENPSLHDKVEFEVAQTALDFCFEDQFKNRHGDRFTRPEKDTLKSLLTALTNNALTLSGQGTLNMALKRIDDLSRRQNPNDLSMKTDSPVALVAFLAGLLEDCLENGTIPFSVIARHAFIAESLLRSAVEREAVTAHRMAAFKASVKTIASELALRTMAVCTGEYSEEDFFKLYGHLRPSTFDIMSPCYRHRCDLFTDCSNLYTHHQKTSFTLTGAEERRIDQLIQEAGITAVDARGLFDYARRTIQGREYAKFTFSRSLSAILEGIAAWGEFFSLGREELSHLSIEDILKTGYLSSRSEITSRLMQKVDQARIDQCMAKLFKLSYLVRGERDIHIVPIHRSEPNFITQKEVESFCTFLQAAKINYGNLKDAIVCIDNADPGFDWIFTKGIAGLITKYGGANSHMAIRCAELQLPAAIGCGEELYKRLQRYRKINLNCAAGTIRALGIYESPV